MDLSVMKTAVTSTVARQALKVKANSPTLLFVGGVAGVVATTYLASKATLQLEDVLKETNEIREAIEETPNYSEDDKKRAATVVTLRGATNVAKLYAPAVGVGVVSIAMLTGSHVVLTKRNAAVMAAYATLEKGFEEYRQRVRDEFGDEKEQQLRYGSQRKTMTVEDEDGNEEELTKTSVPGDISPSVYAKFFDDSSPSWSKNAEDNRIFLQCQQNWANDRLLARGHVFLNEVYDMLQLPRTKAGAVVGWLKDGDGDGYVDFGLFEHDQRRRMFINGDERSILLDFNVDGIIYDKLKD